MDRSVLITGASGGLGSALSTCFAGMGWQVFATDVQINRDQHLISEHHPKITFIAMDVTSDSSVQSVFKQLQDQNVNLSLIINNAGIDRYFPLSEAPVERFREVFEVNVFGAYRVNQIFLPLVKRPGGRIVHIGSESLNLTVPFLTYPLSKKLLEGYAKVLRQELRFYGIEVVVVRPGAIETQLVQQVRELSLNEVKWKLKPQFRKFTEGAAKEIGRTITPETAAKFIYKIAVIRNPASVYRINNSLQLRIAAWLPFSLIEKIVRKRLS